MARATTSDVDFYTEVHALCRDAREWQAREAARRTERRKYECRQWVAFGSPADEREPKFQIIECSDLSTGGFSFLVDDVPPSEELLVRLGDERKPVLLTAKAVNCRPLGRGDELQFLVGCRFTARVPNESEWIVASVRA